MKTTLLSLMIILITATACVGFNRGPFSGKIIDAETKEPIEGAVVVIIWRKKVITGSPGGPSTYIQGIKETLTDNKGEYYIKEYKGFTINPLAKMKDPEFLIFKPGYCTFPTTFVFILACENMKPRENYYEALVKGGTSIELPRLKTRADRLRAKDSADIFGAEISAKDLPLLYKTIDEENKSLGFK